MLAGSSDRPHDRRVDEQRDGNAKAHLLERELARGEPREHGDDDQRRPGDHPRGGGDTVRDRLRAVPRSRVELPDAAEQEHVVVHREPEEHCEEEERHPGLDRVDVLEPEQLVPTPFWKTSTSSP